MVSPSPIDELPVGVGTGIGREVVAALDSAGLATEWDGTAGQRFMVTGLERKRRPE